MIHAQGNTPSEETDLAPKTPALTTPDLAALAIRTGDQGSYTLAALYLYRAVERHLKTIEPHKLERLEDQWRELRAELGLIPRRFSTNRLWGLTDMLLFAWLHHHIAGDTDTLKQLFAALNIRNTSWIAHGDNAVTPEEWTRMTSALLPLLDLQID